MIFLSESTDIIFIDVYSKSKQGWESEKWNVQGSGWPEAHTADTEREIKPFIDSDSKGLMWTHFETMTGSNYSLVIYENTDELPLSAMQT